MFILSFDENSRPCFPTSPTNRSISFPCSGRIFSSQERTPSDASGWNHSSTRLGTAIARRSTDRSTEIATLVGGSTAAVTGASLGDEHGVVDFLLCIMVCIKWFTEWFIDVYNGIMAYKCL